MTRAALAAGLVAVVRDAAWVVALDLTAAWLLATLALGGLDPGAPLAPFARLVQDRGAYGTVASGAGSTAAGSRSAALRRGSGDVRLASRG
jgi:hypothetical protein